MRKSRFYIFIVLILLSLTISAQNKNKTTIHIEHADKASYDDRLGKDVQRLIGNVVIRQDSTFFYSDSAYLNEKTKFFDGFGNVHIKVNDSVNIFSDKIKYNGDTRFAELFDNVKLTDDSTVLTTSYMTYDRINHLATYPRHGVITRNDKKLVSRKGQYRDDIKEFYFRKDVVVTTPKYQMFTDTLDYLTNKEKMIFFGPSTIYNEDNTLIGNYGWYDGLKNVSFLDKRATLKNKGQSITSDSMYYDRAASFAKAMSNVIMEDTTYKAIIEGQYAEMWQKKGKGFVTDSLRALYFGEKDTLYMHSDTMFLYFDTATNEAQRIQAYYKVRFFRRDIQGKCDSLDYNISDSTVKMRRDPVLWASGSQLTGDSINIVIANKAIDSVLLYPNAFIIQSDTIEGYNQIKGREITAFFKKNELNHVYNEGNAETVYWLREEDGTMIGINFSQSVSMDIGIENNEIVRIKYFKKTTEVLYPKDKVKKDQYYLKNFEWRDELRPKDKDDIFRKEKVTSPDEGTTKVKKKRRR